jgi:outer membrane cobalamin receptor
MAFNNKPIIVIVSIVSLALRIVLFSMNLVHAEEVSVPTLDPILVTGSAHPTRLHRRTQSHTILDHKKYSSFQPNRLTSVLQQIPGIHLDEMGSRGGISSVYLRGADPNFTLIMLNGIPLNDSTNQRGGSVDLSTIPIDQITRVDIVRGPLSAFYGSEAMAGAINLVTESQAEDSAANSNIRVLIEGGRFDSQKGLIQGGGTVGPLSANLSFSHSRNEEQIEQDAFSQHAVGWNLGMDSDSDWDIRLTGQYAYSSVRTFPEGSGGPRLALLQKTEERKTQNFLTGLTASLGTPSGWHHQVFLSLSRRSQDVDSPGVLSSPSLFQIPPAQFDTRYYRYQGRLTETWAITPQWTFSLGGQLTHEQGKRHGSQDLSSFGGRSDEPLDFSLDRTFGGTFIELTSTAWESLTLNAGSRLDLSEKTSPKVSPRVSARYQLLPLLHLRGAYGKGFKLPGLASLGDPLIGNTNLKPETNTGWDLGLEYHTPNNELIASIEYFHNRFNKLIDLDPDLLNQGMFQLTNLDRAITKGWELTLKLSPKAPVSFQGNLTYLTTRVTDTGTSLRNRPKWRGGLGLNFQVFPNMSLSSRVTIVSSRLDFQIPTQTTRVSGYTKVDATLTYRPNPAWRWYSALENLTNASYEEFRGFPSPPLTFRVGIEYLFPPLN